MNTLERLARIWILLRPKYYNAITWSIIIPGIGLVLNPWWVSPLLDVLKKNNILSSEFEYNSNLTLSGQVFAIVLIAIGLFYNVKNRQLDLKSTETTAAHESTSVSIVNSFEELAAIIYPLLNDNANVFKSVGPNSGSSFDGELRHDLTMWYKYREATIVPNNEKIKQLLKVNEHILDRGQKELGDKMILHIDAFEEHCRNPNYDYSAFRFPSDFQILIERTCFEVTLTTPRFIKWRSWLQKRVGDGFVNEWFIIGSGLFNVQACHDLDIVVLIHSEDEVQFASSMKSIKMDFKLKFGLSLHETVFNTNEREDYEKFVNRNEYKIAGNG